MATAIRGEGNERRKDRLAKLKAGSGWFVYDGSRVDVEHVPTILLTGARVAVFGPDGLPSLDSSGRQIHERAGRPVRDDKGQPVLGGPPKVVHVPVDVLEVRGVSLPKGEAVYVGSPEVALKLRCMSGVLEVDAPAEGDEAPKKRGRKKAADLEVDAPAEE